MTEPVAPPEPTAPVRTGPGVRGSAVLLAAGAALGAVLGVVWSVLAPGQRFVVIDATTAATLPTESEHVFVDAALFALVGLAAGLISAVALWRVRRLRGPATLLVLVGASLVAAAVAYLVGPALVGPPDTAGAQPGDVVTAAPQLRTWLVLLGQPFGAALGYGSAVAVSADDLEGGTPATSTARDQFSEPGSSS